MMHGQCCAERIINPIGAAWRLRSLLVGYTHEKVRAKRNEALDRKVRKRTTTTTTTTTTTRNGV